MTFALDMAERDERVNWRERAACRPGSGIDPELFFPVSSIGSVYNAQVTRAKAVCNGCSERLPCLSEALVALSHGIAGGMTEGERQQLRRGERAG